MKIWDNIRKVQNFFIIFFVYYNNGILIEIFSESADQQQLPIRRQKTLLANSNMTKELLDKNIKEAEQNFKKYYFSVSMRRF